MCELGVDGVGRDLVSVDVAPNVVGGPVPYGAVCRCPVEELLVAGVAIGDGLDECLFAPAGFLRS